MGENFWVQCKNKRLINLASDESTSATVRVCAATLLYSAHCAQAPLQLSECVRCYTSKHIAASNSAQARAYSHSDSTVQLLRNDF